ncbi:Uncharacterised protein [Mycobacterium tuberculosis]|nr:Uncharacterised protein [Mycobacterium tuberculosis]
MRWGTARLRGRGGVIMCSFRAFQEMFGSNVTIT